MDAGAAAPVIADTPKGGSIDTAAWKVKAPVVLPARGPVAYLDLDRGDVAMSDVRVVDREGRQVPYVVESKPRRSDTSIPKYAKTKGRYLMSPRTRRRPTDSARPSRIERT